MRKFKGDPGVWRSDLSGLDVTARKGDVFQDSLTGSPVLEDAERNRCVGGKAFELSHSLRRLVDPEWLSDKRKLIKPYS